MRIGTCNLEAKWSPAHRKLIAAANCDVWLLTEVLPKAIDPDGMFADYYCYATRGLMSQNQHFAAIASHQLLTPLPEPHAASAAAEIANVTYCSSILPWATCGDEPPWTGNGLVEKARQILSRLLAALPRDKLVWGGDWNQNLVGGWEWV